MVKCSKCEERAVIKRRETGEPLCRECFAFALEEEVYTTCQRFELIKSGDIVAIGVSGGKDSTVLLHVLHTINQRHNMGFQIQLLCIDEGISGYRDNALETVKFNAEKYQLPLLILSFTDLFGWTLNEIFHATQTKETCTYCGIFRRRALDIGAQKVNATKVAVGHNADDISETVLLNVLRGDVTRFGRSVDIKTDGIDNKLAGSSIAPRIKPFALTNQKEIVFYSHFLDLKYYAVECPYAIQAFRRFPRQYLVEKQQKDPGLMRRIIEGAILYQNQTPSAEVDIQYCNKCGAPSNHDICMACRLLEKLDKAHASRRIVPDENQEE